MKKISFKKHFDVLKKKELVFFDNSASTLKPKNVCDAMDYYNRFESVNSGRGIYKLAFEVTNKVERVREKLGKFFNADKYDFVFFKNTSECINQVALMHVKTFLKKDDEIIISEFEHNSNYLPWLNLCNETGAKLVVISSDENGVITFENFKKLVNENTKFVSLAMVNNTFGTLLEFDEIATYCNKQNIELMLDASQSVAHFKIDLNIINPTFFVFSSYKMFGPTGVGVLAIKKDLAESLAPLFLGGGSVNDVSNGIIEFRQSPQKFEAGTQNISGIIGLGEAIDFIENVGFDFILDEENKLKEYFLSQVNDIEGFELYNKKPHLPIFLFNLKNIHAHDVATLYDEFNIMVRAGNHCSILVANKVDEIATVRASLSFINTKKDIDKFVLATKQIIKFFR